VELLAKLEELVLHLADPLQRVKHAGLALGFDHPAVQGLERFSDEAQSGERGGDVHAAPFAIVARLPQGTSVEE
jgi:hypothetical protein